MTDTIENLTPTERYDRMERPLRYVRPRFYPDGTDYLESLLEDEQAFQLERLGKLRGEGKPETDPEIVECRTDLGHLADILREVARAKIDFAGPKKEA